MVNVVKASGDVVPFSQEKLKLSLERAGAGPELVSNILTEIDGLLHEGITTKEIYQKAYDILKVISSYSASKYKLKKAIMDLGPSGYPFEKFISKVLQYQGFNTEISVMIDGVCVTHEIDIVGEKEGKHVMIECKFHNRQGVKSDVKVPLYINSRFLDIKQKNDYKGGIQFNEVWIVTNTRFSEDAIKYGTCAGLKLISWNYPSKGNLRDWINVSGYKPITCLNHLKPVELEKLLDHNIILCRELLSKFNVLERFAIDGRRLRKIKTELEMLCK